MFYPFTTGHPPFLSLVPGLKPTQDLLLIQSCIFQTVSLYLKSVKPSLKHSKSFTYTFTYLAQFLMKLHNRFNVHSWCSLSDLILTCNAKVQENNCQWKQIHHTIHSQEQFPKAVYLQKKRWQGTICLLVLTNEGSQQKLIHQVKKLSKPQHLILNCIKVL